MRDADQVLELNMYQNIILSPLKSEIEVKHVKIGDTMSMTEKSLISIRSK